MKTLLLRDPWGEWLSFFIGNQRGRVLLGISVAHECWSVRGSSAKVLWGYYYSPRIAAHVIFLPFMAITIGTRNGKPNPGAQLRWRAWRSGGAARNR